MNAIHIIILLVTVLFTCFSHAKEVLTVGLISPERPPYFWRSKDDGTLKGIYVDLLNELTKTSGIKLNYRFYPQSRLREYMRLGKIDLEPGIDSEWRQEKGEQQSSVYSNVFMISDEVYVFSDNHFNNPPTSEQLLSKQLCRLHGFDTIDEGQLKDAHRLVNESQILDMVAQGHCHYALVPTPVLKHWQKQSEITLNNTAPIVSYQLRFRLNAKFDYLIPELNKQLALLKSNGKFDDIIASYLN